MSKTFILMESASGYSLFLAKGMEEVGSQLSAVQESILQVDKFRSIVKLHAFQPFTSAENALENIMAVSENMVPEDLKSFLQENLPSSDKMKKKGSVLGVLTPNLGQNISEETQIPCATNDVIREIIRGIRFHLEKFISKLDNGISTRAQLGLGHSYSRAKVKFNVNRQDNMIIQAIALLDQLDKDVNNCAMRIKEWYSWHFPELQKVISDPFIFSRLVKIIGSRESLENIDEERRAEMDEATADEEVSERIIGLAKNSMGFEISEIDLLNVTDFAERVNSLGLYRRELQAYLQTKMKNCAPNLANLIGEPVAARLIAHAGSLTNLAKCPASTIQILGAEKALFRALKTKGNTPKYGLIFNSTFIGRAALKNKGRISRYLANKCALASRIDAFSEELHGKYGERLREQVEERLTYFDTGEKPKRNVEVMNEVAEQLAALQPKRKIEEVESNGVTTPVKKSKKSKKEKKSEKKSKKKKKKEKK